jgi:hypothetical protein
VTSRKAQDGQQVRHSRRVVAVGAAVAAAAVVAALAAGPVGSAFAALGGKPAMPQAPARLTRAGGPLAGGSGTPAGWAPVPFRRAQLSVPGKWLVESQAQLFCGQGFRGMIFAGLKPVSPAGKGCGLTASVAWIRPAGHIPAGLKHRKPTAVINGIPVYRLPAGPDAVSYLVPELGVRVGARGPQAQRVLATLTRSPLSVLLSRGPAGQVPASWVWHRFGGVRFAVPPTWQSQSEHQWATCGTGLVPSTMLLINATKRPAALPCPFPVPTAAVQRAEPGLTVVTGKYAAVSVNEDFTRCLTHGGARVCLSSVTGRGGHLSGLLIFSATRPGRPAGTFLLLGLPGSGASSRVIFDSIRVASH